MIGSRRRGEGLTEYGITLSIIMVCSVVGLFTAGSRSIQRVAASARLCQDCPTTELTLIEDEETEGEDAQGEDGATDGSTGEHTGDDTGGSYGVGDVIDGGDGDSDLDGGAGDDTLGNDSNSSSSGGLLDTISSWWEDDYLSSFMGIFGWFAWV